MALITDIKGILINLLNQDDGWANLFTHQGWTISAQALSNMSDSDLSNALLNTTLTIDRTLAGFEDFSASSAHLITPGKPYDSLLYHAFASANVVEAPNGNELRVYPDLKAIDTIENYVFASKNTTIDELVSEAKEVMGFPAHTPLELAVAVFGGLCICCC